MYTVRPLFKTLHNTLWNIWTYQQLCKKIAQLVYNFTQVVYFFAQQFVGSYVSQCCVNFLNSGLTVYKHKMGPRILLMHNAF